jgi:hypothetical protein
MAAKAAETAKPDVFFTRAEMPIKLFAEMSETEFEEFDREFVAALEAGDDSAARASLAAGVPIYYAEEDTPASGVIKEYPDGRKELVAFVNDKETLLQML